MKPVYVNYPATIIAGTLFEMKGNVVAFDSVEDEVWVQLDAWTTVMLSSDYIEQEVPKGAVSEPIKPEQIEMDLGPLEITVDIDEHTEDAFAIHYRGEQLMGVKDMYYTANWLNAFRKVGVRIIENKVSVKPDKS